MNIQDWQLKNDIGRRDDQQILFDLFSELERNQSRLLEVLGAFANTVDDFLLLIVMCNLRCKSEQYDGYDGILATADRQAIW